MADDQPSTSSFECKKVCFGGELVELPKEIWNDTNILSNIVNSDVWSKLSESEKTHLKRFLPNIPDDQMGSLCDQMSKLDQNFHFGNPLVMFHRKLIGGWFDFDQLSDELRLRDNGRVMYDHYIRRYYIELLQKLLISRRQVLEMASSLPEEEKLPPQPELDYHSIQREVRLEGLKQRAAKRARLLLSEVKESDQLSSDDEDLTDSSTKFSVAAAGESTLHIPEAKDLQMHQPLEIAEIKDLLEEYQILKESEGDHPSLEYSSVILEEVIERAGLEQMADRVGLMSKRPSSKLDFAKMSTLKNKN